MPAEDSANIFRPDTRPAWIEAAQVVAFFYFQHKNLVMAAHNNLALTLADHPSCHGSQICPRPDIRFQFEAKTHGYL